MGRAAGSATCWPVPGRAGTDYTALIAQGTKLQYLDTTGATVKHKKHGAPQPPLGYSIYGLGQPGTVRVRMKAPFVVHPYSTVPAVATASPSPAGRAAVGIGSIPSERRALLAFQRRS